MSNLSLRDQLQAVATKLSGKNDVKFAPGLSGAKQQNETAVKPANQLAPHKKINSKPLPAKHKSVSEQKPKWLIHAQYGVELLKTYFPQCFFSAHSVKPLKKGIKQDIIVRLSSMSEIVTDDKACMIKSLSYYVNTAAYHKKIIAGATRIDLDGQPAGIVSQEEAQYSLQRQQVKAQAKINSEQNNKKQQQELIPLIHTN